MPPLSEIAGGLYGAWRLARLDPAGLKYFNTTVDGFWRSFFAAILVAPLVIALFYVRYSDGDLFASPLRIAAIETVAYVMAWVAFPVVMVGLSRTLDRENRYITYIVAYNWASVWQNLVFLPIAILIEIGMITGSFAGTLSLVLMVVVLSYTWVVTRYALDVTGGVAAMLVAVDLVLSFAVNFAADVMLRLS